MLVPADHQIIGEEPHSLEQYEEEEAADMNN
jgi:hypothetical protein